MSSSDGSSTFMYLVKLGCPNCDIVVNFVAERDEPVPVDQDISYSPEYCPDCGFAVALEGGQWDLREEAFLERRWDDAAE